MNCSFPPLVMLLPISLLSNLSVTASITNQSQKHHNIRENSHYSSTGLKKMKSEAKKEKQNITKKCRNPIFTRWGSGCSCKTKKSSEVLTVAGRGSALHYPLSQEWMECVCFRQTCEEDQGLLNRLRQIQCKLTQPLQGFSLSRLLFCSLAWAVRLLEEKKKEQRWSRGQPSWHGN